jgi:hypothetical protein
MAKLPVDPRIQASLQAAHFERWRKRFSRSPVFAPRNLEDMLPESVDAIPALRAAARADRTRPHPKAGEHRYDCALASALSRAQLPTDMLAQVFGEKDLEDWQHDLSHMNGAPPPTVRGVLKRPFEIPPGLAPVDNTQVGCRCGAACQILAHGDPTNPVIEHRADLSFNADTYVSEATEYVVLEAGEDAARKVLKFSKPPNWAMSDDDAEDFFKESVVVKEDGETPARIRKDEPFFLREKAEWQLNRDFSGSSLVVLKVQNFREEEYRVSFDYDLRECKETRLFVALSRGGIDRDEGHTDVAWVPRDDESGLGYLHILATKRVRFEATRLITRDQALLLNMIAPATLSMLMQQLAFDGPLQIVTNPQPSPRRRLAASRQTPRQAHAPHAHSDPPPAPKSSGPTPLFALNAGSEQRTPVEKNDQATDDGASKVSDIERN